MTPSFDVAIVGSGPYGLSVAAHLQGTGLRVGVFGKPMDTWLRHMPQGMSLKSDGFASDLFDPHGAYTLKAYCRQHGLDYADVGEPVPLKTFADYGLWFQKKAAPDLDEQAVTHLERQGSGYLLTFEDGASVSAAKVVLAVGISHFSYTPPELAALPPSLVSHSYDHACPASFAGRDLTVLGGGSSAIDLSMLLKEAGADVTLLARREALRFNAYGPGRRSLMSQLRRPTSALGAGWSSLAFSKAPDLFSRLPAPTRVRMVRRALGPAAAGHIRERVEGRVPTLLGRHIVEAAPRGDRLRLRVRDAAGQEGEVETGHLITATGYRADIARLSFLSPAIGAEFQTVDGSPRLNGSFESTLPGLYFVGLAAAHTFGPVQRFAFGAGFAARRLRRSLA